MYPQPIRRHCQPKYTYVRLTLISFLRSLVVRALHRHYKGLGLISAGGLVVDEEFFSTVAGFNVALYISSTPVCCCQLGLILINFGTCKIIHRQKRTSCSKSVAGLLPCSHQGYQDGLLRLDDNKSAANCQQACCKLILKTFYPQACSNNLQASLQKSSCI